MSSSATVDDLLLRWEDARRCGEAVTPEELCRDCPERIGELRERIAALASMESLLDPGPSRTPGAAGPQPVSVPPADGPGTLPQRPPLAAPGSGPAPAPSPGRYRTLRAHARGGLGEVFVAEDDELGRPVALKRIQGRRADDPESRRRFLREAQITARLQHPGIVPVYGLTADERGRPSYAMRFIEGESLQDAILRLHTPAGAGPGGSPDGLKFRELLSRFVAVCNTVAYAHSRGILHRDLKPANVMLGPYGETLVVDWGLAKSFVRTDAERAAGEETLLPADTGEGTAAGQAVGTPAYMSPEQAEGRLDELGPPGDLFSLGATLYALLTGQAPYQGQSVAAVLARAQRCQFPPPRQVKPEVPPALEAVSLRAMARRPQDRYGSALELAADVERWLADEPVTAYRDPWRERVRRWAKRHRVWVAAAVATLIVATTAATGGAILMHRQQQLTAAQRDRADANVALADDAAREFLTQVAENPRLKWGDFHATRRELLTQAVTLYERLTRQQAGTASVEAARGRAYTNLAYLRGELGDKQQALDNFRQAQAIFAELVLADPAVTEHRVELARSQRGIGQMLYALGKREEAEAAFQQARQHYETLATRTPAAPAIVRDQARNLSNLGIVQHALGRRAEAERSYRQALELQQSLPAFPAAGDDARVEQARTWSNLGVLLQDWRRLGEAEAAYRQALGLQGAVSREQPEAPIYRRDLARTQGNLCIVLREDGRRDEAESECRSAIQRLQELVAAMPAVPDLRQDLAALSDCLGGLLVDKKQWDQAENILRSALAVRQRLAADHPDLPEYRQSLAHNREHFGGLLASLGRWPEAAAEYREALRLFAELAERYPAEPEYRQQWADGCNNFGNRLAGRREFTDALALYHRQHELYRQLARQYPDMDDYRDGVAQALSNLGNALNEQGRYEEALDPYGQAIHLLRRTGAPAPATAMTRGLLRIAYWGRADSLAKLKRHREALPDWERALALDDGSGRTVLRLGRAAALALTGAAEKARAAADELAGATDLTADNRYDLACVYALAAAQLPPAEADTAAAKAVAALRQAFAAGYRNMPLLLKDPDIDPIRRRADFAALLWDLADLPASVR